MKIKPEHYSHMLEECRHVARHMPYNRAEYIARISSIPNIEKSTDPDKRYRWDLMYAAGLSRYVCDNVYPYANDDHIDTALRQIVKELNL